MDEQVNESVDDDYMSISFGRCGESSTHQPHEWCEQASGYWYWCDPESR